ncbi:MAG TPA: ABC transporter substrate-binding protein [Chloroflexota bacterium]|nr:ABC transporter substrate-binding protein [Chloroflexota bacterium]
MTSRAARILAILLTLILGISLRTGTSGASSRYHGTLVVDYQTDLSHLDPALCYDSECYPWIHALYDQLVTFRAHSTYDYKIVPDAAVALPKISNGGRTYTFRLAHNLHFWNGTPVTSADWKYSFERVINPKTQSGAASFWLGIRGATVYSNGKAKHVSGIQTLGKYGLRITLDAPDSTFLDVLGMPMGSVVDPAQIRKYGNKGFDSTHPMGTGPYMFQQRVLGQRLVIVPNPHYFKGSQGHLASIEAQFGINESTGLLRIERGQADLDGDGISSADFETVLHDPKWGKQVDRVTNVAWNYISMNTLMKPFTNKLVRRAVNYAINKQIILRLLNNRGIIQNTIEPSTMPGFGAFNLYPYNPGKARRLLKQAGYPHGFSTTFWTDNIGDDPRVSQNIAQQLAGIGIHASLKTVDGNTWTAAVGTKKKVPITLSAWSLDFPDPNDFIEPILSCESAVPGTYNESWYCDPKVDRYAHELKIMQNQKRRLSLYPRLDRMIMEDAPVVPLYTPVYYDLHSLALHNYFFNPVWGYSFVSYSKS